MLAEKPGRAFVLAAPFVRRAGIPRVSDVRQPGSPPGSRMWLGTPNDDACGVQPRRISYGRASISRWLPYPRGRSGGRLLVHARLQGVRARAEPAPVSRETHVWALRVPGAAAGMLSDGWP